MADVRKILCAVDFSDYSRQVAEYGRFLGEKCGAKVLVLYAAPSLNQYVGFHVPPSSIETFVGEIVTGAEESMNGFLEEHFRGVDAEGRVVTGYAAEEILTAAENEQVDLIIMGTHGRRGIDRILFGSVAEKVVKSAKCPVMTIRPEE
jgi:nucleotide-binding universal stress UspA family protein